MRAYRQQGATAAEASLLAELDHLAAQGLDERMLTAIASQATHGSVTSEGGGSFGGLLPVGDLDGGGADVLEVRVSDGEHPSMFLVARQGLTGAVLWHRTLHPKGSQAVVPVPAMLGSPARPGVLLVGFDPVRGVTTLDALNGSGRQLWHQMLTNPPLHELGEDSRWGYSVCRLDLDQSLRAGAIELLASLERWSEDDSGV
jgi:hypothetical protein